MITPGDPRHGTYAGYRAGCDCGPCSDGAYRYMARLHFDHDRGIYRTVDARGVVRRVRALQALGWGYDQIARRAGLSSSQAIHRIVSAQSVVHASTRDAISRVYDELCMTLATDPKADRKRSLARKNGYAPPMAWDDIDQDDGPVTGAITDDCIDENVVVRVLNGERLKCTPSERSEVIRRWMAADRSINELQRVTGWKVDRYINKEAA